jgi:hypothetical protein
VADAGEIIEKRIMARVRRMPREKLPALEKLIEDLEAAEVENTHHAKERPRPDWIEARKNADGRRRDGKPVADVLAEFISDKFAGELADGTMSTQKLYRYEGLHSTFYNHRDELPPDLHDMPTRSEVNDRMVAEGKVRGRMQVRRARQRGTVPPI